ncbi:P-type ATPase [Dictyostelium discoideum AX4]|uniref:Phospholipid-transporting ATPase n=1 Tax=Dictyostelium discoideum TaxID=44689 RepID=Q54U08_DICDI|nr:P-type ATPase [Dictyostelium discoideum AX4]EAL66682.1 P-type ATPase [Dictyostelium discoideum AX4]|eukprot:XP_640653.1 P-type ATPase [Dictyostelium discoideum AX4]
MYSEDPEIPMNQEPFNNSNNVSFNNFNNFMNPNEEEPTEEKTVAPRTVHIGNLEHNYKHGYGKNEIATSRYSSISRIPRIIVSQLIRLINVYFIIIIVLSFIDGVSPTGKFTTLGPWLITITISVLREIIEDLKRQKQDEAVNYGTSEVFRNGQFVQTLWKDIRVGDIVKVRNRQYFPADIYIFSTSEPENVCWFESKNLDGETNLKQRQATKETIYLKDNAELLSNFCGLIECNSPTKDLLHLKGSFFFDDNYVILTPKQLLLRGTKLRNTEWINGVVMYTGIDTKLMQNTEKVKEKKSHIEDLTNHFIIFIFFLQILLCGGSAIANGVWSTSNHDVWYLLFTATGIVEGGKSFLTFLVLYNNIIPISFYATIEVVRFIQTCFINNDVEMYHEETDTPALVKTANLNEELGQIEYVFTDKTGTLTQNAMTFKKCSIGGYVYGDNSSTNTNSNNNNYDDSNGGASGSGNGNEIRSNEMMSLEIPISPTYHTGITNYDLNNNNNNNNSNNGNGNGAGSSSSSNSNSNYTKQLIPFVDLNDDKLLEDLHAKNEQSRLIEEFFYVLSICHSVIPLQEDGKVSYIATSPDENALVFAAKSFGFEFIHKTTKAVYLKKNGVEDLKFELLNVLDFSSERKRMSVIVKTPTGRIMLYCKGADSVIFDKLAPNQPNADTSITHIQDFGYQGLRTLCVASTQLDERVYQQWAQQYHAACSLTIGLDVPSQLEKDKEIERVAELIETDFQLLGVTGVEDKLQEGVPETIQLLTEAGIKMWMLTGDGQENAINIGYSSGLMNENYEMIIINERTKENAIQELNRHVGEQIILQQENNNNNNDGNDSNNNNGGDDDDGSITRNEERNKLVLVIDGGTLKFVLDDAVGFTFLRLAKMCDTVICCRVSAHQKSKIVKLVRKTFAPKTLAIGDGANDVMMIQCAHVGIGINGKEGNQAIYAADYSISQFQHLGRLLMVHGHHSYRRMSKLICYIFYKNIVLYFCQFLFAIFSGWSGQTLFETYNLTAYSVVYTLIPLIVYCVLEKDVNERTIYQHPQLYKEGIQHKYFNHFTFLQWIANGFYHGFVAFALVYCTVVKSNPFTNGQTQELYAFGIIVYSCVMLIVTLKLALETHHWTWINHLAMWGSLVVFFIWNVIYATINTTAVGSNVYYAIFHIGESAHYYLLLVFVPTLALWRDFTWKYVYRTFLPDQSHIIQEIQRKNNNNAANSKFKDDLDIKSYRPNNVKRSTSSYSISQEGSNSIPLKNLKNSN